MRGALSLAREARVWARGGLLLGVDEAGRGPLAGPVLAAAVAFPPGAVVLQGVQDSKTLSEERRAEAAEGIRATAWRIGIGAASTREIDRVNIRVATAVAMRRAIERVLAGARPGGRARSLTRLVALRYGSPFHIVIDGIALPEVGYDHEALVDGDALCYSVAAAGIIAKTVRDRLMQRLAGRHPAYGWGTNMGYATAIHLAALDACGPTAHHRRSFAPVLQLTLGLGA